MLKLFAMSQPVLAKLSIAVQLILAVTLTGVQGNIRYKVW